MVSSEALSASLPSSELTEACNRVVEELCLLACWAESPDQAPVEADNEVSLPDSRRDNCKLLVPVVLSPEQHINDESNSECLHRMMRGKLGHVSVSTRLQAFNMSISAHSPAHDTKVALA